MTAKMIEALARHERAVQSVAEIRKQIGDALCQCPVSVAVSRSVFTGDSLDVLYDDRYRLKTHLWYALNGSSERLDDDEVAVYLSSDDSGCPHCAKAWELIMQRKKARQDLGAARRLIRYYGKKAMAMQGGV